MSGTILCNLSDANTIIEEARQEWVREVLFNMGVDEDIIMIEDIYMFRNSMEELGIEITSYANDDVDIFKKTWYDDGINQGWLPPNESNLVAQWKAPERIKKIENGDVYYEIHLNEWKAFR